MLDLMRKKKESIVIKVVFVVIVLSFIGTMFLVWGKGSDGIGGSKAYAAKVGNTTISLEDYQRSYQRIRNVYQQIYGQAMTPDMEKNLGIKKIALDSLIDNVLVLKEAKSLGVTVSKDEVAASIEATPTFQKNGKFDFKLYQQLLNGNRITPKDFETSQQTEITLIKARNVIKSKTTLADSELEAEFHKNNDKIELEAVSFAPTDVIGEVKVTDAQLSEYMEKHKQMFMTPEKVAFSYVLLEPSSKITSVTLTEDEISSYYQKNIDKWQGKDGVRPLQEVRAQVEVDARKQKTAKMLYELAADTLFKNIKSQDFAAIAAQLHSTQQHVALFSITAPPAQLQSEAALIKKVFSLKKGEVGGPVETSRGIYLVQITERQSPVLPPLSAIRSVVEQTMKSELALELAHKKAEEALKQLAGSSYHAQINTGLFGYSSKGDVPIIGNSPELMEAAFKLTQAAPVPSAPSKVGNRWYAVRLKQRVAASVTDFASQKESIRQKLLPKKQEDALAAWLKELKAKTKIDINKMLLVDN